VPDKITGEYNGKKVYLGPRGGVLTQTEIKPIYKNNFIYIEKAI
jgi:hypothetical protein